MKRALITGITGQDGSYLAEFLLEKGYEVHGIMRRSSSFNTGRIDSIFDQLHLHYGDMTDPASIRAAIKESNPQEVYNLAAQSHVMVSFQQPEYTWNTAAGGTLFLLSAVHEHNRETRIYQASSSEMFGQSAAPQNEHTQFNPVSPYGTAKVAAHFIAQYYRRAHGMFVSCGILFNHESPRRGETFLPRKVTRAVGRIKAGLQTELRVGSLDPLRDWGFAGKYVEAMWLMLQQNEPDDYVIGTGEQHSVEEWITAAFSVAGLDWRKHVRRDLRYQRPAEVYTLMADARKAQEKLGWKPTVRFRELVEMMVEADLELAKKEVLL